ncbi:MAG: hypothetical protein H6748_20560 [Spirochaetaceae bacterium]|nr:hypothetical protein [Spirochaetaceae bacterium]
MVGVQFAEEIVGRPLVQRLISLAGLAGVLALGLRQSWPDVVWSGVLVAAWLIHTERHQPADASRTSAAGDDVVALRSAEASHSAFEVEPDVADPGGDALDALQTPERDATFASSSADCADAAPGGLDRAEVEREIVETVLLLREALEPPLERTIDDLDQTRGILRSAVAELDAGFRDLEDRARQQKTTALEVVEIAADGTSDGRATGYVGETESVLQAFVDLIVQTSKQSMALVYRFMIVDDLMKAIDPIIRDAENIADQTKLLALNAAIEASRVGGPAGARFSVVASEVKSVATHSNGFTKRIRDVLSAVREQVEVARDLAKAGASRDMNETLGSKERVAEMIQEIEHRNARIQRATDTLSAQTDGISKAVSDVIRALQFEDITTQLVDRKAATVRATLDLIANIHGESAEEIRSSVRAFAEREQGRRRSVTQDSVESGDVELF